MVTRSCQSNQFLSDRKKPINLCKGYCLKHVCQVSSVSMPGCPVLLFFPSFLFFLYFEQTSYMFEKTTLIISPRKSCFHRNLQHLPMSFCGPSGPQTPAKLQSHIFITTQCALLSEGSCNIFSLYIEGRKKSGLCLIVLISPFQVRCTFLMVFADINSPF